MTYQSNSEQDNKTLRKRRSIKLEKKELVAFIKWVCSFPTKEHAAIELKVSRNTLNNLLKGSGSEDSVIAVREVIKNI